MTLQAGQKGRLKASRREFEIISTTTSATTAVKFRGELPTYEMSDSDLRDAAVDIADFTTYGDMANA